MNMSAYMSRKREKRARSRRPGFCTTLVREIRDCYFDGDILDGITLILPISMGALFGLLLSLTIEADGGYLVRTNTLLWAGTALAFALGGALTLLVVLTAGLALVVGIDLLMEERRHRMERVRSIRDNIQTLRKAVVGDRVLLSEFERVRTSLRVRDQAAEQDGTSWYERLLVSRWRRRRDHVEGLLESSWREALPEAIEILRAENRRLRRGAPEAAEPADTTDVAWHLVLNPTHIAVQRLLCEYLRFERRHSGGHLRFHTGVVFTPRWVYELVRHVENHPRSSMRGPWGSSPGGIDAVGNECVPIGDVDRETVEKLYEPRGAGPLGSLRETIETARRI